MPEPVAAPTSLYSRIPVQPELNIYRGGISPRIQSAPLSAASLASTTEGSFAGSLSDILGSLADILGRLSQLLKRLTSGGFQAQGSGLESNPVALPNSNSPTTIGDPLGNEIAQPTGRRSGRLERLSAFLKDGQRVRAVINDIDGIFPGTAIAAEKLRIPSAASLLGEALGLVTP